jgi:hypothetical protein
LRSEPSLGRGQESPELFGLWNERERNAPQLTITDGSFEAPQVMRRQWLESDSLASKRSCLDRLTLKREVI